MFSKNVYTLLFAFGVLSKMTAGEPVSNRASPNWTGVFDATNGCDLNTCCCPSGSMTLSRVEPDKLRVQGQFDGLCPQKPTTVDSTIAMPSDYRTVILFLEQPVGISLSADSREIVFNNPLFPNCDGKVVRKNGAMSSIFMNVTLIMLLSGVMTLKPLVM